MPKKIFQEEILISKVRAKLFTPLLIKAIEKKGKVKLEIDKEGNIIVSSHDVMQNWTAKQVIEAIGRGFEPEIAQKIFKDNVILELISLKDFSGKSKNKLIRLKGRVIGQKGKSKNIIQKYTNTSIVVYGKTVGIVGETENVSLARRAIETLLTGAKHATVYGSLLRQLEKDGKTTKRKRKK